MGGSLHVLVADDEQNIRSLMKRMLQQMRCFEVIEDASDGEHAWEKISKQRFDLIVTDINMPRLDGIELLKRCRASNDFKDIPFLMVTGEATTGLVASAGEWGAHDYLIKPFSYIMFKARVDGILDRLRSPEELLYRKLQELKEAGECQVALEKIEQWEKITQTTKAKWLNFKGEVLMDMGRLDEAGACFEQAVELAPNYLSAFKSYAVLQQKLGNREKAIGALESIDRISPMDPERKLTLGKLMLQTGRLVEGKQYLDQAIKQAPRKDKESYRLKAAESYLAKGMFREAEEAFVSVLKSNVNEIEIFNRLGIALRRQGKFKEAIRYYQLALKHHPANAAIHYNLGILYVTLQDRESGQHCFEKALEIDPGFEKAWEILEQLRKGTEPAASQ